MMYRTMMTPVIARNVRGSPWKPKISVGSRYGRLSVTAMIAMAVISMAPPGTGGGKPGGKIGDAITRDFGDFERFKKEFSQAAVSCEGSGWAALNWCGHTERILIGQIEKHNVNVNPQQKVLLALDVWEHAYYLDYKNDRAKFVASWWDLVNWDEVDKRMP